MKKPSKLRAFFAEDLVLLAASVIRFIVAVLILRLALMSLLRALVLRRAHMSGQASIRRA